MGSPEDDPARSRMAGREPEGARARRREADAEARLRVALAASAIGTYTWHLDTDRVDHDAGIAAMFGLDGPSHDVPIDAYTQRIHPDDRAAWLAALDGCHAGADFRLEYRVVLGDGVRRWLLDQGTVFRDARGVPTHVVGAIIDVTDRKRAMEAALDADRRKDEFLAMLSHELRNPLAPLRVAVDLLRRRLADAGLAAVHELEVIDRQTSNLTRIVDDLLDVARITRGKIELRKERLDLAAVVARGLESARTFIEPRRHEVITELPAEPVAVVADPVRIEQVLVNLLSNAAKYTDDGGTIVVSVARAPDGWAELRVRDNGIGIDAGELDGIFGLFYQGEETLDRTRGGLGIGLTIVRSVVEMHGGRVVVRSAGTGRGAEFVIRLPPGTPHDPAPPSTSASRRAAPGRPLRILVVDDNQDAAELLAEFLAGHGHVTRAVFDGPSAIEATAEFRPELILLDIGLPGLDGYAVAQQVREAGSDATLVALTGYGQERDRQRVREAGFAHHLVKPVDIETLMRIVAGL